MARKKRQVPLGDVDYGTGWPEEATTPQLKAEHCRRIAKSYANENHPNRLKILEQAERLEKT